jgi:hypothetical protein
MFIQHQVFTCLAASIAAHRPREEENEPIRSSESTMVKTEEVHNTVRSGVPVTLERS